MPLGYNIYPRNTFGGKTVNRAIRKIKKEYDIKKLMLIGDRDITSKKIMEELEKEEY